MKDCLELSRWIRGERSSKEERNICSGRALYESLYRRLRNLTSTQPMIVFIILKLSSVQVTHVGNLSRHPPRSSRRTWLPVQFLRPSLQCSISLPPIMPPCLFVAHRRSVGGSILSQPPVWSSFPYSCSFPVHPLHCSQGVFF